MPSRLMVLVLAAVALTAQTTPDQQFSLSLLQADQAKATGDTAAAVKLLEDALNRTRAEESLKSREQEVLQKLSAAYLAAQRPQDAVRSSTALLDLRKDACKPGAPTIEQCADAQYALGLAMMYAGDFTGALKHLDGAARNFTNLKQKGDAQSLAAAALFRTGQKAKAIQAFKDAIATLTAVAKDEKLDAATRAGAQSSIKDAQSSLALLEK